MERAYVGLGSNLGDPAAQVREAAAKIDALPRTSVDALSRLYRSAPWGDVNQPAFVNAVAAVTTSLTAGELLRALLAIERSQGRVRGSRRWGPRIIDLDLLLYGDRQLQEPGLQLPHPRLAQRAFVLVPLNELAADANVPGEGLVRDLLATCDNTDDVEVLEG